MNAKRCSLFAFVATVRLSLFAAMKKRLAGYTPLTAMRFLFVIGACCWLFNRTGGAAAQVNQDVFIQQTDLSASELDRLVASAKSVIGTEDVLRPAEGYLLFKLESLRSAKGWAILVYASYPDVSGMTEPPELVTPMLVWGLAHQTSGTLWQIVLESQPLYSHWIRLMPDEIMPETSRAILLSIQQKVAEITTPQSVSIPGLPYAKGTAWRYNQGPHWSWATNSSLDFGTPTKGVSDRALAAETGVVINTPNSTCLALRRGGDGLIIWYQHIATSDIDDFRTNDTVNLGQSIGMTTMSSGCGGTPTGHHVHITWQLQSNQPYDPQGSSFNGWVVVGDQLHKNGTVVRPGIDQTVLYSDSTPSCRNPNSDEITLYVRAGFDSNGQCVTKGIGEYRHPSDIGLPNDSIHSIKVGSDVRAQLCQDDDFNGSCQWFESDNGDLNGTNVGYGTSSVKVETKPTQTCSNPNADQITLYVRTGFDSNGECVTKGIGEYRHPSDIGLPNDSIRSTKVGSNVHARLCQDDDFNGSCQWFESDNGDLNGSSVGYGTSSVKVEAKPATPGVPSLANPANGAVLNRNDSIALSWNTASNANSYYAHVWGGPNIDNNSGWTGSTSWSVGALWGGSYQWQVKARNSAGTESGWSETRNFTVKYGSPSSLSASVASGSQINLSWNASADAPGNIDGYRIYRDGSAVATVGSSVTAFQNSGLTCGTAYNYVVKAYKGNVESDASNTASATPSPCTPPTPPNLRVTATTAHSVSLAWDDVSGETKYNIYRWDMDEDLEWDFYYLTSVNQNVTTYTHTGLHCGFDHFYEVSAVNDAGESAHAPWVKGTALACPDAPTLVSPGDGAVLNDEEYVSLSWSGNAYSYYAEVWPEDNSIVADSGWTARKNWELGRLASGRYYWRVKAGDGGGGESDWSEERSFTVESPACAPAADGIVLYEHSYYTGRCITLTEGNPSLGDMDFNDIASSVQFVGSYANSGWQISLFGDAAYAGSLINLRADDPDLSNNSPLGDNQLSSIRIWQDSDDARTLTMGQLFNGTIQVPSDSDFFQFHGSAGQVVTITMDKQDGGLDPYVVLFGPAWGRLAADDNGGGNGNARILNYRLWAAGTYRIFAQSANAGSAGAYQLRVSAAQCTPGADGIVLYEGVNYTGRCVTLTGSEADLRNRDFNDSASSVRFVGSYANSGRQVSLFVDTYFAGAYSTLGGDDPDLANNLGNRMTSSMRLWYDSDDGRQLSYGQSLQGNVNFSSDADSYWFYGTAGQIVTIAMNKDDAGLDPYLTLYGPAWGLLATNDDGGGNGNALIYRFRLWTTGVYRIYGRSSGGATQGRYTVSLSLN